MITKEDYEYLKSLLSIGGSHNIRDCTKAWYVAKDTVGTVAGMLNNYNMFVTVNDVINFFKYPRRWEGKIQDLIREYEREAKP